MPLPKRIYLENHVYFITTDVQYRYPVFLDRKNIQIFLTTIDFYRKRGDFYLLGYVAIPCHLHLLILPKKENISIIMKEVKNYISRKIRERLKDKRILDSMINKTKDFMCGRDCRCELYSEYMPDRYGDQEVASTRKRGRENPENRTDVFQSHVAKPRYRNKNYIVTPNCTGEISRHNKNDIIVSNRVGEASWPRNRNGIIRRSRKKFNRQDLVQFLANGKFWQKGFYDHIIRNEKDFREKLNYINSNAQKHGITENLEDYMYSSWQNYYSDNDPIIKIDKISL